MKALLALALLIGTSAAHADLSQSECSLSVQKYDGTAPAEFFLAYKRLGATDVLEFTNQSVVSASVSKLTGGETVAASICVGGCMDGLSITSTMFVSPRDQVLILHKNMETAYTLRCRIR